MTGKKGKIQIRDDGTSQFVVYSFDYSWHDYLIQRLRKQFKLVVVKSEHWWVDVFSTDEAVIKIEYEDEWCATPTLFIYAANPESNDFISKIADYIESMPVSFTAERSVLKRILRRIDTRLDRLYHMKRIGGMPIGKWVILIIVSIAAIAVMIAIGFQVRMQ